MINIDGASLLPIDDTLSGESLFFAAGTNLAWRIFPVIKLFPVIPCTLIADDGLVFMLVEVCACMNCDMDKCCFGLEVCEAISFGEVFVAEEAEKVEGPAKRSKKRKKVLYYKHRL